MIKVFCQYLSLSELPNNIDLMAYNEFIRPLDYEFSLERGAEYLVIAIVERKGIPWLYVTSNNNGDTEIDIVPAVLFSFDNSSIISGMIIRMTNTPQPSLEILPVRLSSIDNWFERYIDGDDAVIDIIESEINVFRSRSK